MNILENPAAGAAKAAYLTVLAVRHAHSAACPDGRAMELLLREALDDAVRLHQRLELIANFAAGEAPRTET